MYICGIDEAGRGPVIGPLVMCAAVIDKSKENEIKKLGIRDSKKMSVKKREETYPKIKKICDVFVETMSAKDIDKAKEEKINLNKLEELITIKLIQRVKEKYPKIKVIADAPDTNFIRYGNVLSQITGIDVKAEHKADDIYPIVSASSVIAKVDRDNAMKEISKEYNLDLGSGYPADPITKKALRKLIETKSKYIRYTWSTAEKIVDEIENSKGKQSKLL